MIKHVSLTTVYVSDQDKALDFYVNKLGFEVRADATMGDMRWIQVAPRGAVTTIVLAHGYGGWSEEKVGQFTCVGLEADDLEATYRGSPAAASSSPRNRVSNPGACNPNSSTRTATATSWGRRPIGVGSMGDG